MLAIRTGAYFPGLITAPFLGAGGFVLLRALKSITERDPRGAVHGVLLFLETIAFTIVVPGTVTIWLPRYGLQIWGDITPSPWTWRHIAALVPLAAGLAVYARCVWDFATRGHGIPAPIDHPKQLVVTGLYRYVRNPMYVGVLLVMLGEALFFGSLSFLEYTFIWFAFVHLAVLIYEEPNLRRKFGESYERYCASVKRWIPGRAYR
jgi:protein-S-isoprenylcysteine O-methyltransferase Ste14